MWLLSTSPMKPWCHRRCIGSAISPFFYWNVCFCTLCATKSYLQLETCQISDVGNVWFVFNGYRNNSFTMYFSIFVFRRNRPLMISWFVSGSRDWSFGDSHQRLSLCPLICGYQPGCAVHSSWVFSFQFNFGKVWGVNACLCGSLLFFGCWWWNIVVCVFPLYYGSKTFYFVLENSTLVNVFRKWYVHTYRK